MGNPYAPKKKAVKPEEVAVEVEETEEEYPTNVKDIIEWVGEDQDRAQLVYDEESGKESPRKTLISALEDVLNG